MTVGGTFYVLCWPIETNSLSFRVYHDATPDLLSHFKTLAINQDLPSLDTLLHHADILVGRYASQEAYEQSLSAEESRDAPEPMKVKPGPAGTVPNSDTANANVNTTTQTSENHEVDLLALPTESVPKVQQEVEDFDGDRVLANSILFLQDFGWWIEISYAVPEGDIGRVFEILKVKLFK